MIPKTLFLAFLSLQVPDERLPSSPLHGVTTFNTNPFRHELQTVVQNPFRHELQTVVQNPTLRLEHQEQHFNWDVDFDQFSEGEHKTIMDGSAMLISEAGWIVPGYWFGPAWKFPSGRQKAYAINPTTNPKMTLKFIDRPHKHVNMTLSFWDYDIPKAITCNMEAKRGGDLKFAGPVNLDQGWNEWAFEGIEFDELTLEVQGKADTAKDLLIMDKLSFYVGD